MAVSTSLCLATGCGDQSSTNTSGDVTADTSAGPTGEQTSDATSSTSFATETATETATATETTVGTCPQVGPEQVTLQTADGVELIADLYTTGHIGDPVVLLLHMIPPGNDKSNFTPAFIEAVRAKGFNVLNINRRGASGSGGAAVDAYMGPNGVEDAVAGYLFAGAHECGMAMDHVAIVGASNGSTTALDFTIRAAGDPSLQQPVAMVFLSGGMYTENQHTIADHQDVLANHAVLLAYPPGEASWNQGVLGLGIAGWEGLEVTPGAHGTLMFDPNPEVMGFVADFLATHAG